MLAPLELSLAPDHKRLIKSKGPDSVKGLEDFKFETIPDGLPPSDTDGTQDVPRLSDSTRKNCLVPFKEVSVRLNSSSEGPPVSCVISDGVMSFGIKAAADLGAPHQVQFWTASACSFIGYLHYRELIKRGIFPFKSWCEQEKVLGHSAVGAFLTHCGWNLITESICAGVAVIGWPFFADQQTNCHYACDKCGIGMEINHDVKREEVAALVREMMVGERGKQMRIKAQEWKRKAEEATDVEGLSYNNFHKFINEALHFKG